MGEAVRESEASRIIAVPRSRLRPTGPPSAAALEEQLVWRLLPEKQVPGQHERASASQEPGTAAGFTPRWLAWLVLLWVGGRGNGQQGWLREQVALGLVWGLVCGQRVWRGGGLCGGLTAHVRHGPCVSPWFPHWLGSSPGAGTRCDPARGPIPSSGSAQGRGSLRVGWEGRRQRGPAM